MAKSFKTSYGETVMVEYLKLSPDRVSVIVRSESLCNFHLCGDGVYAAIPINKKSMPKWVAYYHNVPKGNGFRGDFMRIDNPLIQALADDLIAQAITQPEIQEYMKYKFKYVPGHLKC